LETENQAEHEEEARDARGLSMTRYQVSLHMRFVRDCDDTLWLMTDVLFSDGKREIQRIELDGNPVEMLFTKEADA